MTQTILFKDAPLCMLQKLLDRAGWFDGGVLDLLIAWADSDHPLPFNEFYLE